MKHFYLKYVLYLCLAINFITSNSNEIFLQPGAHESFLCDKVGSHEPRVFIFEDMRGSKTCVEIDGAFYVSINCAGRKLRCQHETIKRRCLSNKFPNYKIVPSRITCMEKKCSKCRMVKPLGEFSKDSSCRDELRYLCKGCSKEYKEEWEKNNPDYAGIYRQDNKEKTCQYNKEYRSRPEVRNELNKKQREKRRTDIALRINGVMGNAVRQSLKSKKNGAHWEDLVSYTCEELMSYLESKFTEGMSWDNYGKGKDKWNIDHIKAVSKFNIISTTCQEFLDCWDLSNLQPLWGVRNIEKGDKPMHPKYLIKPF